MASVKVIQGVDKGRSFDLRTGENIIGRLADPVTLTDGTVSRRHAGLTGQDGQWTLKDMGSANGTFLNGERVNHPCTVKRGDQIRCGATLLVFSATGRQTGSVDLDEDGRLVDAAIVATVPSNEDSVILPTPEAGAAAIGNLRILYDLISEIGSFFNVDQLLDRELERIFEIVEADRGYILLFRNGQASAAAKEPERRRLELKTSRFANGSTESQRPPISRTIINEVIAKQVGILSTNAMSDKRFSSGKSVQNFGIRSALCVPIKGREHILGVIHVDRGMSDHTYTTEQLRLLTAVGFQTGLAVENVRLYETALQSERLAAVGETVAVLSHHTKNILQALGAGIDVVEMGLKKGNLDTSRKAWPIVQRNLQRINELILNMLTFSKDREPLLENINPNHVVQECIDLATPRADERQVALLSDLDDLAPIRADAAGLHQAVLNLIQNALDAVEDKTGAVTVTSRYDSANRQVQIAVVDNGKGIEPEKLNQIFTPFYSAKGQKGTGLGLAVARKVVAEHKGDIQVDSTPGQGTSFTITLPIDPGTEAGETSGPAEPHAPGDPSARTGTPGGL